jgi:hypothetical protein
MPAQLGCRNWRKKMTMIVSFSDSKKILNKVHHKSFVNAIDNRWYLGADGQISVQSICWLFCWAKTGMGSETAAIETSKAFDSIFNIKFGLCDTLIEHNWARKIRYKNENNNYWNELNRILQ